MSLPYDTQSMRTLKRRSVKLRAQMLELHRTVDPKSELTEADAIGSIVDFLIDGADDYVIDFLRAFPEILERAARCSK